MNKDRLLSLSQMDFQGFQEDKLHQIKVLENQKVERESFFEEKLVLLTEEKEELLFRIDVLEEKVEKDREFIAFLEKERQNLEQSSNFLQEEEGEKQDYRDQDMADQIRRLERSFQETHEEKTILERAYEKIQDQVSSLELALEKSIFDKQRLEGLNFDMKERLSSVAEELSLQKDNALLSDDMSQDIRHLTLMLTYMIKKFKEEEIDSEYQKDHTDLQLLFRIQDLEESLKTVQKEKSLLAGELKAVEGGFEEEREAILNQFSTLSDALKSV